MYREADGPDGVRKAVREQLRDGADFIKVMTTGARSNEMEDPGPAQFTDAEFAALVDEARRMGVKVAAHAEGLDGVSAAVRHAMDTIEHGMYLNQRPDLLDQMAAGGQVLVPTLSGYYWMGGMPSAIDPASAVIDADTLPLLVELARYNLEQGTLSMRAAARAGVRIGLGSDAEGLSGDATALELVRMIRHGLSPADALRAATSIAAKAIGLHEHIGTVQAGKLADLLVVDGDVLAAPELLLDPARIWLVVQLGHLAGGTYELSGIQALSQHESRDQRVVGVDREHVLASTVCRSGDLGDNGGAPAGVDGFQHGAGKRAADDGLVPQHSADGQPAVGSQDREPGAGARTAGGPVDLAVGEDGHVALVHLPVGVTEVVEPDGAVDAVQARVGRDARPARRR